MHCVARRRPTLEHWRQVLSYIDDVRHIALIDAIVHAVEEVPTRLLCSVDNATERHKVTRLDRANSGEFETRICSDCQRQFRHDKFDDAFFLAVARQQSACECMRDTKKKRQNQEKNII